MTIKLIEFRLLLHILVTGEAWEDFVKIQNSFVLNSRCAFLCGPQPAVLIIYNNNIKYDALIALQEKVDNVELKIITFVIKPN